MNGQESSDYNLLLSHCKKYTKIILRAKNEYTLRMSRKLKDPSTALKCYWSIGNCFLNNKKNLVLLKTSIVISELNDKANLFNSIFASQCICARNSNMLVVIRSETAVV